ncbi:MAG: chromate transporter [Alphaproteobacteria bacterium]
MTDAVEPRLAVAPVTVPALFVGFLQASLCAFGGGMVWVHRMVVERRRWLGDIEFAEILSLCQFMPGPNGPSLAVCVGARLRGVPGAAAALAGFIAIPWTIGFAVGVLYLQYADLGVMQDILRGIAAAAAGLIIGTGLRLLLPHRRRPAAVLFAALGFIGLALLKLPLFAVLLALAPVSIAVAAFERGRAR